MTQRSRQSSEAKLAFLTVVISRTAFWGALGVITWMALTPRPPVAAHSPSDAIQHFVAFSYLGSIPFWWLAGKYYKKHMVEKDEENARLAAAN